MSLRLGSGWLAIYFVICSRTFIYNVTGFRRPWRGRLLPRLSSQKPAQLNWGFFGSFGSSCASLAWWLLKSDWNSGVRDNPGDQEAVVALPVHRLDSGRADARLGRHELNHPAHPRDSR